MGRRATLSAERRRGCSIDASATPDRAPPFSQRALSDVVAARASAARGQRLVTIEAINDALLALAPRPLASAPDPAPSLAPVRSAIAQPAPLSMPGLTPSRPPPALYRLEPGHWQLSGAKSVWGRGADRAPACFSCAGRLFARGLERRQMGSGARAFRQRGDRSMTLGCLPHTPNEPRVVQHSRQFFPAALQRRSALST